MALAIAGGAFILRRQPAFLALWVAVLAPPALYVLVGGSGVGESQRHLIYGLPLWAAQIGAGFATLTERLPLPLRALLLATIALVGAAFHGPVGDPRGGSAFGTAIGDREGLRARTAWLEEHVEPADVLFDYSPAFLAALETTRSSSTIAPGRGELLRRSLEDVDFPVSAVVVSLPLARAVVDPVDMRRRLGEQAEVSRSRSWLLVRRVGPFSNRARLLRAVHETFEAERRSLRRTSPELRAQRRWLRGSVCRVLSLEEGRDTTSCR